MASVLLVSLRWIGAEASTRSEQARGGACRKERGTQQALRAACLQFASSPLAPLLLRFLPHTFFAQAKDFSAKLRQKGQGALPAASQAAEQEGEGGAEGREEGGAEGSKEGRAEGGAAKKSKTRLRFQAVISKVVAAERFTRILGGNDASKMETSQEQVNASAPLTFAFQ